MGRKSKLEKLFDFHWEAMRMEISQSRPGDLILEEEVRFHPTRRWRFDYAHPAAQVAIEIEGGVWVGGRHTRPAGYEKDCEKYNAAAAMGWTVFRLTGNMIGMESIEQIQDVILAKLENKKAKKKPRKKK